MLEARTKAQQLDVVYPGGRRGPAARTFHDSPSREGSPVHANATRARRNRRASLRATRMLETEQALAEADAAASAKPAAAAAASKNSKTATGAETPVGIREGEEEQPAAEGAADGAAPPQAPQHSDEWWAALDAALWNVMDCLDEADVECGRIFGTKPDAKVLPTYYKRIHEPIALSDMHERMNKDGYASFEDLKSDLDLLVKNAHTFNAKKSLESKVGPEGGCDVGNVCLP